MLLLININEVLTIRPLGPLHRLLRAPNFLINIHRNNLSSVFDFSSFISPSVCRSPAAGGHVQLLVSRPVGTFRFLRHVWLWWAELSTSREEEVDAIVPATRVRTG